MKKTIFLAALALVSIALLGQEQEQVTVQDPEQPQVQAEEQPQVQAEEQPQVQAEEQPQVQAEEQPPVQGKDLKRVRFPEAFIHAGKEYPAGDYWLVLATKDGQPFFAVQNAQKELLFEDLAIVKDRRGNRTGSAFFVGKKFMTDKEYFRIKVTTPGEWLLGYFLVKR